MRRRVAADRHPDLTLPTPHDVAQPWDGKVILTYLLGTPGQEVVRLLQVEIETTHGQPELYHSAWKDYLVEEDFDRQSYGLSDGEDYSLVSMDAVLNIEPRLEQNYWVLRVVAHKELGPRQSSDAGALIGATLTLDQFKAFLQDKGNAASVRLDVTTPFARQHLDAWLAEQRLRRPAPLDVGG